LSLTAEVETMFQTEIILSRLYCEICVLQVSSTTSFHGDLETPSWCILKIIF